MRDSVSRNLLSPFLDVSEVEPDPSFLSPLDPNSQSRTPSVLFPVLFDFFRPVLPNRLSMQFVLYALALAFGITTAVANPILYTSLNESFRQTLKARRMMGGWQRGSTATSSATTRRSTMKNDNTKLGRGYAARSHLY